MFFLNDFLRYNQFLPLFYTENYNFSIFEVVLTLGFATPPFGICLEKCSGKLGLTYLKMIIRVAKGTYLIKTLMLYESSYIDSNSNFCQFFVIQPITVTRV